MSEAEVNAYLARVPETQRAALAELRALLVSLLPGAQQGIAYGVPCFKVGGKGVAGFGVYKNHCTYFPMSGSITTQLADELTDYETAKGSIRFTPERPLTDELVRRLVEARQQEITRTGR